MIDGSSALDHGSRFAWDNIIDGVRDESLILWPALDTVEMREVWIVGRRVKDRCLPVAVLLSSSPLAVKRYAPATGPGEYDTGQIDQKSRIIRP